MLVTPQLSDEINALLQESQDNMVNLVRNMENEGQGIVNSGMRAVRNMDAPYMDMMVKQELTVWRRYYG